MPSEFPTRIIIMIILNVFFLTQCDFSFQQSLTNELKLWNVFSSESANKDEINSTLKIYNTCREVQTFSGQ